MNETFERYPSSDYVSIQDLNEVRIAIDHHKLARPLPFATPTEAFNRIIDALDVASAALEYFETEGRRGQMPLVRQASLVQRIVESIEFGDDGVEYRELEYCADILRVMRDSGQSPFEFDQDEIERIEPFIHRWETAELEQLSQ